MGKKQLWLRIWILGFHRKTVVQSKVICNVKENLLTGVCRPDDSAIEEGCGGCDEQGRAEEEGSCSHGCNEVWRSDACKGVARSNPIIAENIECPIITLIPLFLSIEYYHSCRKWGSQIALFFEWRNKRIISHRESRKKSKFGFCWSCVWGS